MILVKASQIATKNCGHTVQKSYHVELDWKSLRNQLITCACDPNLVNYALGVGRPIKTALVNQIVRYCTDLLYHGP